MIKNPLGSWIAAAILGGFFGYWIQRACFRWLYNRNWEFSRFNKLWRVAYFSFLLSIVFFSMIRKYGFQMLTVRYLGLVCILFGIALIDRISYQIPNGLIIAGGVWWLLTLPFMGDSILEEGKAGLLGAFCIGGGIFIVALFLDRWLQKESIGGGDVKLFFVLGLYFGISLGILHLILSCIVGILFIFLWKRERIPFGPAIAISAWFVLLFGKEIIYWYWNVLFLLLMM